MAPYQSFKLYLVETIGLSKIGFHFVLGFLVYLIIAKIFSIRLTSPKSLIAPVLFAVLLEVMDFRDAISYKLPIDWFDSFLDILLTVSLPAAVLIAARFRSRAS